MLEIYLIRNVKTSVRKKLIKTLLENTNIDLSKCIKIMQMEDIFLRYFMKRKTQYYKDVSSLCVNS